MLAHEGDAPLVAVPLGDARPAPSRRRAGEPRSRRAALMRAMVSRDDVPTRSRAIVVVTIDGPAGRRQVDRREAARAPARLSPARHRRDLSRGRARGARSAASRGATPTRCAAIARALDIRFDFVGDKNHVFLARRGRHRRDPHAGDLAGRVAGVGAPAGARRAARRSSAGSAPAAAWSSRAATPAPSCSRPREAKFFLTATERGARAPPGRRARRGRHGGRLRQPRCARSASATTAMPAATSRRWSPAAGCGARRQLGANPRRGCGFAGRVERAAERDQVIAAGESRSVAG